MHKYILQLSKLIGISILLFLQINNVQAQNKSCACDTVKTKAKVSNKNFSALPQFDKLSFTKKNFENLDQANKKVLWYRELECTDSTKFTRMWDDYDNLSIKNNSPSKFLNYYKTRKDIEIAVYLGVDLWGGNWYFIFKKIGCCYLITKNYHDRTAKFAHKSYAIITQSTMDEINKLINQMKVAPLPLSKYEALNNDEAEPYHISAIINNKTHSQTIAANYESETVNRIKENEALFDFLDNQIYFTVTMQF
ncbi:MAG TPA: hypothetical protein PLW32_08445 [Chitinophagaceae bacterium]|mgnify:FL=1|nr:hypothetical protein [Chitinophagaceae bacterium]